MAGERDEKDTYGILLGWKADPAGDKISLLMQSTRKVVEKDEDVRDFRYFLTRQQAVQLGNYLFGVAGETPPVRKKRGLIEKLFGD